jgi:type IV secretory pathway VirD2 relaxase
MSDIGSETAGVFLSFARQVRAICFIQGRGYLKFWPQQTKAVAPLRDFLKNRQFSDGLQRAVVKARFVGAGRSAANLQSHLRYLLREGVSRDGNASDRRALYSQDDRTGAGFFLRQAAGDYRHIRLVVSIEQGASLADLRPIIRRLMAQMQRDLRVSIEWLAVDHYNTPHPHSHIVLRARDGRGRYLFVPPTYLKTEMRQRVRAIVTHELGPPATGRRVKAAEIAAYHGPTAIDRVMCRDTQGGVWAFSKDKSLDLEKASLLVDRVRMLHRLGLADELAPQTFQFAPNHFETLQRIEQRRRLYELLARELKGAGIERAPAQLSLFRDGSDEKPIVGRVLAARQRGLREDFLAVETSDGRVNHIPTGGRESDVPLTNGMIIRARPRYLSEEPAIDRTITAVAAKNHGLYSRKLHASFDRRARPQQLAKHERRLNDLAASGIVAQKISDVWYIGRQFLDRASWVTATEPCLAIEVLSIEPLERLVSWRGATYLDRFDLGGLTTACERSDAIRNVAPGYFRDLNLCLRRRANFLSKLGILSEGTLNGSLYGRLRRHEMQQIRRDLSARLDRPFARPPSAGELRGRCRGKIALASEWLAVVERHRDFTIVPWSRSLENTAGMMVTITIGRDGRSVLERDHPGL